MKFHHLLILSISIVLLAACGNRGPSVEAGQKMAMAPEPIDTAILAYGMDISGYKVHEGTVQSNEFLADILLRYDVPYKDIDALARNTRDTFDVRKIRAGQNFTVLSGEDSTGTAEYFIYESGMEDYVVFCLKDSLYAYCGRKPVEYKEREASGIITSSLYNCLTEQGHSMELAIRMADLYAWTIDFYRLQKGDSFKLIYEEKMVDGQSIGPGKILAATFQHREEEFTAYHFKTDTLGDYFDAEGNSLRKAFLKAPLKFSRISSRFSKRRFHPVLKRYKAHLGTDYAAPHGTPILAVVDGEVIKSSFTRGNGNYVKIKHNSTYSTQYLHMSKRAVKKGDYVRQGEVIGYVGSTGLATGPHVCFRFWKNGEQVDPLRETFPPSHPIPDSLRMAFDAHTLEWNNKLSRIEEPVEDEAEEEFEEAI